VKVSALKVTENNVNLFSSNKDFIFYQIKSP